MQKLKTLGAAMLASLVAANAYAASCVTDTDVSALETAALQQELMVAAFTCHQESRYNQFVRAHRPELIRADAAVKAFFVSRGRGEAGYHSFKTDLANNSAMSSARAESFCGEASMKFDQAQSARGLGGFTNAALQGYGLCPGVVRSAAVRPQEVRQVAEQPSYARASRDDYSDLPPINEFDYPAYDVRSKSAVRDSWQAEPEQDRSLRNGEFESAPVRERSRNPSRGERYAYRDEALEEERGYYDDRRASYSGRYDDRYSAYGDRYAPRDAYYTPADSYYGR